MTDALTMPFGPHQGTPIAELPSDYLNWMLTDINAADWPELVQAAKEELKYRSDPVREFEVMIYVRSR